MTARVLIVVDHGTPAARVFSPAELIRREYIATNGLEQWERVLFDALDSVSAEIDHRVGATGGRQ